MSRSCHRETFSRRGHGVAPQHPGEPGDLLALDRVALVGHRRGALLTLPEGLLDLAHLGPLQVAQLGGEALQAGAGEGDRATAARRGGRGERPAWRRPRGRGRDGPGRGPRTRGSWPRRCRPRPTPRRRSPARRPARRRPRLRWASKAKPASLRPKLVGSAWTPWVLPTARVSDLLAGASRQRLHQPAGAGEDQLARHPAAGARGPCRARPRR